jgi:hypothetical protein
MQNGIIDSHKVRA